MVLTFSRIRSRRGSPSHVLVRQMTGHLVENLIENLVEPFRAADGRPGNTTQSGLIGDVRDVLPESDKVCDKVLDWVWASSRQADRPRYTIDTEPEPVDSADRATLARRSCR